jgi:hypothetical protein
VKDSKKSDFVREPLTLPAYIHRELAMRLLKKGVFNINVDYQKRTTEKFLNYMGCIQKPVVHNLLYSKFLLGNSVFRFVFCIANVFVDTCWTF